MRIIAACSFIARMTASALLVLALAFPVIAEELRKEPLVLKEGGTPEEPAVFDGRGLVIDLGTDVSAHDWSKQGDLWTSSKPLPKLSPVVDDQRAGLFLGDHPLRIARDRAAEKQRALTDRAIYVRPDSLKPGQMGWADDGCVYFRWPADVEPGSLPVIQPPENLASGVVIACSYITVRNVIVRHAANDGFNIHGDRQGVRLENVKAFANGDEGVSAHETVQMDVVNSEIAWNGSIAGGVADVNDSTTTYTNCELHHNLGAAFFFEGKSHRVTNCLIHHQAKDVVVRGDDVKFESSGVKWIKD